MHKCSFPEYFYSCEVLKKLLTLEKSNLYLNNDVTCETHNVLPKRFPKTTVWQVTLRNALLHCCLERHAILRETDFYSHVPCLAFSRVCFLRHVHSLVAIHTFSEILCHRKHLCKFILVLKPQWGHSSFCMKVSVCACNQIMCC